MLLQMSLLRQVHVLNSSIKNVGTCEIINGDPVLLCQMEIMQPG